MVGLVRIDVHEHGQIQPADQAPVQGKNPFQYDRPARPDRHRSGPPGVRLVIVDRPLD